MAATYGDQGQDKLVSYTNSGSYNEQSGVKIKP